MSRHNLDRHLGRSQYARVILVNQIRPVDSDMSQMVK